MTELHAHVHANVHAYVQVNCYARTPYVHTYFFEQILKEQNVAYRGMHLIKVHVHMHSYAHMYGHVYGQVYVRALTSYVQTY
jgi:hypothetical protein